MNTDSPKKRKILSRLKNIVLALFGSTEKSAIIAKSVFFGLTVLLSGIFLFGTFKGMSSPQAMENAALGRELIRGNGLHSKVIYPAVIRSTQDNQINTKYTELQSTYTAPVFPIINAGVLTLVDGGNTDKYKLSDGKHIYTLDRALAATSLIFFLLSIGVNYQLAKLLFDANIARATAILMLLSETMWQYVQSCLPQMFMLFLFSLIVFISAKAIIKYEKTAQTPWTHLFATAFLFSILILTKWTTSMMFIGYLGFVIFYFNKKRVGAGLLTAVVVATITAPALLFNYVNFGSPLGAAGLSIINGLGGELSYAEELGLRNFNETPVNYKGAALKVLSLGFAQVSDIVKYMAGIIAAPLFFLALLHVYRRMTHNTIKWLVLIMWVPAVLAMAIYGITTEVLTDNQLHLLFAPVMTIFGLSIVSIMWTRLTIAHTHTLLSKAHFFLVVLFSSGALLSNLPKLVQDSFESKGNNLPHLPYYHPKELTSSLPEAIKENASTATPVVYSDQPHAVAWYADSHAIWLPHSAAQMEKINQVLDDQQVEVLGIHTTASSSKHYYENKLYSQLMPLVNAPILGWMTGMNIDPSLNRLSANKIWSNVGRRFPYTVPVMKSNKFEDTYGRHFLHLSKKTK